MRRIVTLAMLTAALSSGCSGDLRDDARPAQSESAGTAPAEVAPVPPPPPPPPPPGAGGPAEPNRVKADVGVGRKGHYGTEGAVVTPISTYFRAQERITFEIQIPGNMNIFKSLHERAPRTHEEFMKEIIQKGGIKLPDLPEGHRYVYDPEKEELMVEQGAPGGAEGGK